MTVRLRELNEELIENIHKGILLGMPPRLAAQSLGVPLSTFRRWISIGDAELAGEETELWKRAGKPQRAMCAKLADTIAQAKAELMKQCVANLRKKSVKGPWQIDAWLLERLYPQYFANRVDIHARIKKGADKATISELLARMAAKATDESD